MSKGRLLLWGANGRRQHALATELSSRGYECVALKCNEALAEANRDVVIVDVPSRSRGDFMAMSIKLRAPQSKIIVATSSDAADACEGLLASDAVDHVVVAPFDFDEIEGAIERVRRESPATHSHRVNVALRDKLVGLSPAMAPVLEAVRQAAPSRATVVITGESGTGKELVAEAVHELSPRNGRPFVRLNCAALADTLLESELFGHERGSFTGAMTRHEGHFERAHTGTLFLDEIADIGPSTQTKLLRFLQERTFERVGGGQTIKVDVRIIAATNRPLRDAVRAGTFREDLYYRLNVINIQLPPLRQRAGDVRMLALRFLRKYAVENDKQVRGFSAAAMESIARRTWAGNVRELENAIERAVVLAEGECVHDGLLPPEVPDERSSTTTTRLTLAELEKRAILSALAEAGGSTTRAAELLGISVRKVQYRLKEYGLPTRRMSASGRTSEPAGAALAAH